MYDDVGNDDDDGDRLSLRSTTTPVRSDRRIPEKDAREEEEEAANRKAEHDVTPPLPPAPTPPTPRDRK
jgi:hypothetical protein